ncbi:MAG: hypothetical protein AABY22_12940, partial [Nanoarchaeota archaeon]
IDAFWITEAMFQEMDTVLEWVETVNNHKVDLLSDKKVIKKVDRMGTIQSLEAVDNTNHKTTVELHNLIFDYNKTQYKKKQSKEFKTNIERVSKIQKRSTA